MWLYFHNSRKDNEAPVERRNSGPLCFFLPAVPERRPDLATQADLVSAPLRNCNAAVRSSSLRESLGPALPGKAAALPAAAKSDAWACRASSHVSLAGSQGGVPRLTRRAARLLSGASL